MTKIIFLSAIIFFSLIIVIYIGLSLYITNLAFQVKINLPETNPEEYNIEFEEIEFFSNEEEEITLRGWWIPTANSKGTIIWIHGLDANREGEKMELISEIHSLGFSVLTFDLRGHGYSDEAPLGLGLREKNDVLGAIQYLKENKNIHNVGVMGLSYGAVIGILAAEETNSIVGVFADSPYYNIPELLAKEVSDRTPIPKFIANLLKFGIIKSSIILQGINIEDIAPQDTVSNLNFPIIIVHCENDERIPVSHSDVISSNSPKKSEYQKFEICEEHGKAYEGNKDTYMKYFKEYFDERFN
ncbi:MAG: hypothetical protein CL764_01635 [Chloroflexi bacterium]|nr:hypothetical protein [Chloroflexota bacterium]